MRFLALLAVLMLAFVPFVGCSDDDSAGVSSSSGNSVSSSSGNSSISVPATFEEDMSLSQSIRDYYRNAYGKSGAALKAALTTIISSGYTDNGYGGLWTTYLTSDVTPAGKIWDLYSNTDLNGTGATASYWFTPTSGQCGSYSGEGGCYNREHMIPQSKFSELAPMVSDAHFITATDGKVNGQRSDYPHGNVASATWTSQNGGKLGSGTAAQGYTGTCFEPVAAAKGDIARMYFYFSVRYAGNANCAAWESMGAGATLLSWAQNLYVDWSTADPVCQKERTRNQAIYVRQGNRNPFIDYPVLVYMLFGTGSGIPASSSSSTSGDASSSAAVSSSAAPVTDGVNLFPNCNFESDASLTAGSGITLAYDTTTYYEGARSLHVTGSLSANGNIFSLASGVCYDKASYTKVVFWIKGTSSAKSLSVRFVSSSLYWNLTTMSGSPYSSTASGGYGTAGFTLADWTKITLTLPAGNTSAYGFDLRGGASSYDFYIDGIQFE